MTDVTLGNLFGRRQRQAYSVGKGINKVLPVWTIQCRRLIFVVGTASTCMGDKYVGSENEFGFAEKYDLPIPYLHRITTYYQTLGYGAPYRWAQYNDVPFTPLTKPLSESRRIGDDGSAVPAGQG